MAVFNLPVLILSDRTAPVISGTSVGNPLSIDENVATSSLVATMTDDGTAVSYAIVPGSNTNGDFAIANNGDITVVNPPNYEATPSYNLEITATDALGNTSAPFTVTININDLDEIPPVVTVVSQTYNAVFETDNNLTIASFTATDTDNGSDVTSSLTLSGTPNATNFALSYNSSTQQMDLVTASSGLLGGGVTADQTFTLTVSATDAAGNTGSQPITLVVKNAEVPTITSGATSITVQENSAAAAAVLSTYTATGTLPITWSLTGADSNDFNINSSGELTFSPPADYETQTSHSINAVATNQFGSDTRAVSVTVTNDPTDDPNWWTISLDTTQQDNPSPGRFAVIGTTAFWAEINLSNGNGDFEIHKATLSGNGAQTATYSSNTIATITNNNQTSWNSPKAMVNRNGALFFALEYQSNNQYTAFVNTSSLSLSSTGAVSASASHDNANYAAIGSTMYSTSNTNNGVDFYNAGSDGRSAGTLAGSASVSPDPTGGGATLGSKIYFIEDGNTQKLTVFNTSNFSHSAQLTLNNWPGTLTTRPNVGVGTDGTSLYVARSSSNSQTLEIAKYDTNGNPAP